MFFVGPDLYFGKRSSAQQAAQLALKREYEVISELSKLLVRGGPKELVGELNQADAEFRNWLDLDRTWGLSINAVENSTKALESIKPVERIFDVLDASGQDGIIIVADTNSLLAESDPTKYRESAGQDSFVFILLPTVLGELDKLKVEHRNPELREKARNVISRIKGWRNQRSLIGGVVIDKSITVRARGTEPDVGNSLSWLDPSNSDDRIIASVLSLQVEFPSARVVLVSGDINLLNKADVALIETADTP